MIHQFCENGNNWLYFYAQNGMMIEVEKFAEAFCFPRCQEDYFMDPKERALKAHRDWQGKIEVVSRCKVENADDLSVAYTPGVAQPCLEIKENVDLSYVYTRRHNLVAVITDGTAVLGLGDIGPEAGMPVNLLVKLYGENMIIYASQI